MKKILFVLALMAIVLQASIFGQIGSKPRLLITTDIGGDPDDQQSLVRLLLYADVFDIEGLIATASGTRGELGVDTVKYDLLLSYVEAYREVYPNLVKHNSEYPTPDYLKSVTKKGNKYRGWDNIGKGHDTQGSEWIIKAIDKDDERPINITIWGGQSDFAQALWKVKSTRSTKDYNKFISKIRVYDINDQDHIFDKMIAEHPSLFYILSMAPDGKDKREGAYRGMYLGGEEQYTSLEWLNENIRQNHGKLGTLYPDETWTAPNPHGALKEGDTPSWFYFLSNGLQDSNHPEYGSWGGRFIKDENGIYKDSPDFFNGNFLARSTVYRWRPFYQNEFAARADRCVKKPDEVNHPPVIVLSGDSLKNVATITAKKGEEVSFDAASTYDPDKDELSFLWWVYPEAGTNEKNIDLGYNKKKYVSFEIPEGVSGKQIHLILQVSDNGEPALTSFQRIIVGVK